MFSALFSFFFLASLAHAEKITASVIDVAPFGYTEGVEKKGLYVEILQAWAKAAGYKIEIQLAPYLRAISLVQSRDVDMTIMFDTNISLVLKTKKLDLYERTLYLFTLKSQPFLSADTISGDIGRLNGGCTNLDNKKNIQMMNLKTFDQGTQLLIKKRLRGICGTYSGFMTSARKLGISASDISYIAIKKKMFSGQFHPDFDSKKFEKLKKALVVIKKNGVLQKIRDKYQDTL